MTPSSQIFASRSSALVSAVAHAPVVLAPVLPEARAAFETAATHLGVWPARIGELELGRRPNDGLAARYRAWLHAA